ncbi:hypothetical protein EVAR_77452_1 [Eumeta japonica]|uniref:Uncharacterized protein n=1 Tax=Eumeta variegata TaxID=151549 RepID=A0A4C1YUP4_EUMVA|nr:hypothetical protein EVAR_77452_1 [Eumeta japonica]
MIKQKYIQFWDYVLPTSCFERFESVRTSSGRAELNIIRDASYRRIRQTGYVHRRQSDADRPRVYRSEVEEEIIRHFYEDPTTSTNTVAARMGLSQWKVWFSVHSARLYPYHYTPVNAIEEGDPAKKIGFLQSLQQDANHRNKNAKFMVLAHTYRPYARSNRKPSSYSTVHTYLSDIKRQLRCQQPVLAVHQVDLQVENRIVHMVESVALEPEGAGFDPDHGRIHQNVYDSSQAAVEGCRFKPRRRGGAPAVG